MPATSSGAQLKSCEEKGMEVYVPVRKHAVCEGKNGRFGSNDFRYDAQDDTVVCPPGQRLIRGRSIFSKGKRYFIYGSTAAICGNCPLSDGCLTKKKSIRKVYRWEHEDVMDRHRKKMSAEFLSCFM